MIRRKTVHPILMLVFSLFLAFLLMACSQSSSTLPYALEVDEYGIGKLKKSTPFDAARVNALLPGFEAHAFTTFRYGIPYPVLRITRHGHEVMIITPTDDKIYISSIAIMHADISTHEGIKQGDAFETIYRDRSSCSLAEEELSGKVLCKAPNSSHLFYLFSASPKASQTTLPALEQLNRWKIDEIIWKS